MPWVGEQITDAAPKQAYAVVEAAADWSPWRPFLTEPTSAPRLPGVYLFREPGSQVIRYAGMAGERAGGGRPMGLFGRLSVYRTGKGAVSGFGEAALDRALADPEWIRAQLGRLESDGPRRAKAWAADAISRLSPEVSWAVVSDRLSARALEDRLVPLLRPHGLWNR